MNGYIAKYTTNPGCLYSLDWTTGLDYWTGLLMQWTTGQDYWTDL